MWERIRREILIEYYWWQRHNGKKHIGKKRRLDSPAGVMGILFIMSGIIVMVIIGQAFAAMFRNMMPLVSGTAVAGTYWSSIIFALKMSVFLIAFICSFIAIIYYKFFSGRKR